MGKKKSKGNGEGTIYVNSKTGLYVGQYVIDGKRHSVYQKKNEKVGDFKARFNKIIFSINDGTYIGKSLETLETIIERHIEQKNKDSIVEQNEHEETDELLPKHEIDDENYSIQTKIITKNDGKFKHIFTEERGLSTGIKKSVETRTIGDKSMSLTRISYPDGKVDEHEDRQNINNDEEFEAFKNEWLSTFPVKAQQIKHETQ